MGKIATLSKNQRQKVLSGFYIVGQVNLKGVLLVWGGVLMLWRFFGLLA